MKPNIQNNFSCGTFQGSDCHPSAISPLRYDISSSLPFVRSLARRYTLPRACAITQDDLIQEGMLGVLEAQHHYDPAYGVTFESYAAWWAKKYISEAYRLYLHIVTPPQHLDVHQEPFYTHSLDQVLGYENSEPLTFADILSEPQNADPPCLREETLAKLQSALIRLSPLEKQIIHLIYEEKQTAKDAAVQLHLTHCNVRKMHERLLHRLRKKL